MQVFLTVICPHCTNDKDFERLSKTVYFCPVCSKTTVLVYAVAKAGKTVGVIDGEGWQDDEGSEY